MDRSTQATNWIRLIVFGILLGYPAVNAEVNCAKIPNFKNFKTCCYSRDPDFTQFPECAAYIRENRQHPCLANCIFNSTGALQSNQYDANKMRSTIIKLYTGQEDMANVIASGMNECDPEIRKRMEAFKTRSPSMPAGRVPTFGRGIEKCSPIANFYAGCAYRKGFINCPNAYWNATDECEQLKEYVRSCDFTKGGVNGGMRRGRH